MKMTMLFFGLLLCFSVNAKRLKYQLDLIYKVGIDKGVILKNELHQIDYLELNKIMNVKLKGRLKIQLYFKKKIGKKNDELNGLICKYKIFNIQNVELHRSKKKNFYTFKQEKSVELTGKNHSLNITIKVF